MCHTNGYAVYHELQKCGADALATLCEPFPFERRGGIRPGETPSAHHPIMSWTKNGLLLRYLRYWIETGSKAADKPLTAKQVKALDTLDEVLRRPELRAEFHLRPRDMFFINNRWLFHNRTAFEDHPELERRRHYVRLWLKAKYPLAA